MCYNNQVHRGVAQLVEYRSPKPWVAGSSPPAPAKKIKSTIFRGLFLFAGIQFEEDSKGSGSE